SRGRRAMGGIWRQRPENGMSGIDRRAEEPMALQDTTIPTTERRPVPIPRHATVVAAVDGEHLSPAIVCRDALRDVTRHEAGKRVANMHVDAGDDGPSASRVVKDDGEVHPL